MVLKVQTQDPAAFVGTSAPQNNRRSPGFFRSWDEPSINLGVSWLWPHFLALAPRLPHFTLTTSTVAFVRSPSFAAQNGHLLVPARYEAMPIGSEDSLRETPHALLTLLCAVCVMPAARIASRADHILSRFVSVHVAVIQDSMAKTEQYCRDSSATTCSLRKENFSN